MHDWITVSHPWQYVMNFQSQDWNFFFFFLDHKEGSLFLPPSLCYSITPWTIACLATLSMGILQARILKWVAYPFSKWSSQLKLGSNWDLLHCRHILYQQSSQGSPSVAFKIYTKLAYMMWVSPVHSNLWIVKIQI